MDREEEERIKSRYLNLDVGVEVEIRSRLPKAMADDQPHAQQRAMEIVSETGQSRFYHPTGIHLDSLSYCAVK